MTISGADIACTLFDACNTRLRVLRHIGADDELQYASSAFLLYLSNTAYLAADSTAKEDAFPETYMVHPPSCKAQTNKIIENGRTNTEDCVLTL